MKKYVLIVLALLLICSCATQQPTNQDKSETTEAVVDETNQDDESIDLEESEEVDNNKTPTSKSNTSSTSTKNTTSSSKSSTTSKAATSSKSTTSKSTSSSKTTTTNKSSSSTSSSKSTSSKVGPLSVKGTKLVNASGKTVQIKGVSTHGIGWFGEYVNKQTFASLKSYGVNTIRLALYTDEGQGYCVVDKNRQKQLYNLVEKGIQYTKELNMYCIVDWHILSDQNPNKYKSQAKTFFNKISKAHKNDTHILYEICNEPNGGTSWSDIKSYAKTIIPVIRKNDPDSVIIVGTPTWSQDVDVASKSPLSYKNVLYSLHFYAATHKTDLQNKLKTAVKNGLPILVSEFGICDASGNGQIDEASANKWMKLLNQYSIGYVNWNLSNKNESSSLLSSNCNKLKDFKTSDLSKSGKWYLTKNLKGSSSSSSSSTKSSSSSKTSSSTNKSTTSSSKSNTTSSSTSSSTTTKISATAVNSWQNGDKYYYQYQVDIKPSKKITNWKIQITFNGNVSLDQGWNGNYKTSGKTLTITPMDYNKTISANDQSIGFIICGSKSLKHSKITIQ